MDRKNVFISYKAEEIGEAAWVKSVLEANGISCWMAPASIPGGSSYAAEIPQAIRNSSIFVLILSEKAQSSKWVSREVDLAINEGKTVLPFMLENCPLKDEFNFYLTNVQRYTAYENKSAAIEKMVREIWGMLGITPTAQTSSAPAATPAAPKAPAAKSKADILSLLSVLLGALAVFSLGLTFALEIAAIALAFLSLKRQKEKQLPGRLLSIVGMVLGSLATVIVLFGFLTGIGLFIAAVILIPLWLFFVKALKKYA